MLSFLDLTREYQNNREQFNKAISQVLSSGRYLNGQQVANFEKEFAKFLGVSNVIATGSGTDAMILSLKACGIKLGDRVIMPANICHSLFGVIRAGAIPVPVDVDENSLNIDLKKLEKMHLPKNTKAIIFSHIYGNPAGILEVLKFARKKKLFLIEDCSQAPGAKIGGKNVGTIGDIACFHFYPTKNLACLSEGGAIATKSTTLADKIRFLLLNGERKRFVVEQVGLSSILDEIQAAILRIKLKVLNKYNRKRQLLADLYRKHLKGLPLILPQSSQNAEHIYYLYVIRCENRDKLSKYLLNCGVSSDIHYPVPLHLQPALSGLSYKKGDFINAERACQTVLSLPLNPFLTKAEVRIICGHIRNFFSKK